MNWEALSVIAEVVGAVAVVVTLIFLGREMSEQRDYSLRTEVLIDSEIDRLLKEGEDNAHRILSDNEKQLDALAAYLLEHETVEAKEFRELMEGKDASSVSAPRFTPTSTSAESPGDEDGGEEEGTASEPEPEPTLG